MDKKVRELIRIKKEIYPDGAQYKIRIRGVLSGWCNSAPWVEENGSTEFYMTETELKQLISEFKKVQII